MTQISSILDNEQGQQQQVQKKFSRFFKNWAQSQSVKDNLPNHDGRLQPSEGIWDHAIDMGSEGSRKFIVSRRSVNAYLLHCPVPLSLCCWRRSLFSEGACHDSSISALVFSREKKANRWAQQLSAGSLHERIRHMEEGTYRSKAE